MDKESIIQRPPKIYLDTNHLIYITKVRKDQELPEGLSEEHYKDLDECIKSYCGLIFNPVATMDWVGGKATTQSTNEIAVIFDSATLKYTMPLTDELVYIGELLEQCHKLNKGIQVPDLPPLPQILSNNSIILSPLNILVNQVPDYLEEDKLKQLKQDGKIPIEIPVFSAGKWVQQIFNQMQNNPEKYQSRIDNFMRRFNYDIEHRDEYFRDCNYHRLE